MFNFQPEMALDFEESIKQEVNDNVTGRLQVGNVSVKGHKRGAESTKLQTGLWIQRLIGITYFRRIFALQLEEEDQEEGGGNFGRVTVKLLPLPGWLVTSILPPWAWAIA
jgi:hypothetical protein